MIVAILPSITRAEYDAILAINWSKLRRGIGKTAAHIRAPAGPDKAAYKFGRAFHHAVLQPELFEQWQIVDGKTTTKPDAITTAEQEAIQTMAAAAYELGAGALTHIECGLTWTRTDGQECKALIDAIWSDSSGGKWLLDLKSTQDSSPFAFRSEVFRFKYHGQAAWYLDGLAANGISVQGVQLLAVEKVAPHAAGMYALADGWTDLGRTLCNEALATLGEGKCGYGYQDLELPDWAQPGLTVNDEGGIDL